MAIPVVEFSREGYKNSRKVTPLRLKFLEKRFLNFKKWVKSMQTAGCDGARTVIESCLNDGKFYDRCSN